MAHSRHSKYRFPWREGNRFEVLRDGAAFFPRMLASIESAQAYVLLEMYLFESGAIADAFVAALSAAARRKVRVLLLLDDFGALSLHRRDRERLNRAGVELVFYNPIRYGKLRRNLFRDHRKMLIVDGKLGFIGGAGVTDAFAVPGHPELSWRETMLLCRGPVLADWQTLFIDVWNRHVPNPLDLIPCAPTAVAGAQLGRLTHTGGLKIQEIKLSLIKHIRNAEHRAWLATAYFIPSWKIRRALRRAVKQGVDVRILLPGPLTDHPGVRHAGRRFYAGLLRNGVRIFEYQPRFLHNKVFLCDHWVSIGSSNLDRWNLRWNLEANQEIDDQGFAASIAAMFEADLAHSEEMHYSEWRRRPWYRRLLEWFYGRIDLLLESIDGPGRSRR